MYASLVCSFRYFSSLICVWGKGAIDSCWKWKPRASLVAKMVKKKKKSTCNAGDPGSIPGSGRSLEEGNGYPR